MENIMHKVRDGRLALDPAKCDVLYEALDVIQACLAEREVDVPGIIKLLDQVENTDVSTATSSPAAIPTVPVDTLPPVNQPVTPAPVTPTSSVLPTSSVAVVSSGSDGVAPDLSSEDIIRVSIDKLDDLMAQVGELLVSKLSAEQHQSNLQDIRRQITTWPRLWREIKMLMPHGSNDTDRQLASLLAHHDEQVQTALRQINDLYQMMNRDVVRMGMITSRLQDSTRQMRMLPFQKLVLILQRTVRDAAHDEKKHATLLIEGSEVELDKKVLEILKDPLMHLVRNAVAHGIEAPDQRSQLGKPTEGQIKVVVQLRGGEVRISVNDDGAGFDLNALRLASAHQGGPILGEDANPTDVISLAFLPGVTTSRQVTSLAGRGVGLDVVKRSLEAIQGRILVDSTPKVGTTFQLIVPASVTMTRGLLVRIGTERYMLPLLSIEKIIELRADSVFTVEGQPVVHINGNPYVLTSLATALGRPVATQKTVEKLPAIVISVANQHLVLVVDEILTEQELAVVPLGKPLKRVRNIIGAAVLGDGQPVVILNTADIIRQTQHTQMHPLPLQRLTDIEAKPMQHILVVDDSITTRTLEKNILEAAGYDVVTATDGELALTELAKQPIDLVVSDIQMPRMDGFTLTRKLRESSEYRTLPIILVTSLENSEDREQGMMAGADAYIIKRGFDQAELLATIQKLLD